MKWWVGVIIKPGRIGDIGIVFPYSGKITEKKFGALFRYMFSGKYCKSGYSSKQEAVDAANYQGLIANVKTYQQVKDMIAKR